MKIKFLLPLLVGFLALAMLIGTAVGLTAILILAQLSGLYPKIRAVEG